MHQSNMQLEHQYDVVPWPDKLIPIDDNIALDDMSVAEASPTGMRIIKSHLEAAFIREIESLR